MTDPFIGFVIEEFQSLSAWKELKSFCGFRFFEHDQIGLSISTSHAMLSGPANKVVSFRSNTTFYAHAKQFAEKMKR